MNVYTVNALGLRGLACETCPGDCPCKRRPADQLRGQLGFLEVPAENAGARIMAGVDWHWLVIAALAILAAWAVWPKPERERRNTEKRGAKSQYLRKLKQIEGGN